MYKYADLGLPVIPLCPADETHNKTSPGHQKLCKCDGKIPLINGWTSKTETSESEIESWQEQFGKLNYNVGLPMGSASGYVGVDIDGAEGEAIYLEMSGGLVTETWEFKTGAGRRLLYQIPVGLKTKKAKQMGESVHSECAILCTGQQTVIPPSKHFSGTEYVWRDGHSPFDMDCAMAPKWIIDLVKLEDRIIPKYSQNAQATNRYVVDMMNMGNEFNQTEFDVYLPEELTNVKPEAVKVKNSDKTQQEKTSEAQKLYNTVVSEGGRDNAMVQIIGYLLSKPEMRSMDKSVFMTMMLSYNDKFMDPPLEQESVEAKVNHLWEIEQQKTAEYKSNAKGKRVFRPTEAAQMVLNQFKNQKNIALEYEIETGTIYTCNVNKGPWERKSNQYLEVLNARIRMFLTSGDYEDESDSRYKVTETFEALKALLINNSDEAEISFDTYKNREILQKYIVVDGQLFDWRSRQLLPWDPNVHATHSFDIGYNASAKCPHWEQYMAEWIPDEGSRRLVQEFLGYTLIPSMHIPIILFLDGKGSNGKSMMLDYIGKLFGDNLSSLSTSDMTSRFGPAGLYGKLLNICTEDEGDGSGFIKQTSVLKALSSGDIVQAEFKGKDAFRFHNVAKLIFATNKVPNVKDKSHGWDRRLKIIKFPNQFKNDTKIAKQMELNMANETPGIFNWLIDGLIRLMDRGQFEDTEQVRANKEEYKAVNDPIEGFLQECTEKMHPDEYAQKYATGISTTILYALYTAWCEDNYGDKAGTYRRVQKTFTQTIKDKGYDKSKGRCIVKHFLKQEADRQQIFYHIKPVIKNEDFYERLMEYLKGYGAIEAEGMLLQYFKATTINNKS